MRHIAPIVSGDNLEAWGLPDDAVVVLRPDFRMRRDAHFVSFWRVGDDSSTYDFRRLDPLAAIMLALFDGKRTVREVTETLAAAAKIPLAAARDALSQLVSSDQTILVSPRGIPEAEWGRYNPLSMVIPGPEVDLAARRPSAPLSVIWNITNECRADCIYCFAERQRHGEGGPPLPLVRVLEIVDELAELGVAAVLLEGGDPFTHRDIVRIVEAIVRNNLHLSVSTKCEIPRRDIKRLVGAGLTDLQVSVDTLDEPTHVLLTRSPGLLRKTLITARRAIAAGLKVRANAVITPYNLRHMGDLTRELVRIGVSFVHFADYSRSAHAPREDLFLSSDELSEVEDTARELQEAFPDASIRFDREQVLPFAERAICSAGAFSCTIFPDGKVGLCEQSPSIGPAVVGDLSRESLGQVWTSGRIEELLHPKRALFHGTACENCEEFDQCHTGRGRCFIKSLKAYGKLFAPVPECPRAPTPAVRLRSGEPSEVASVGSS